MYNRTIPVIVIAFLFQSMISSGQVQYAVPEEGWLHIYEGNVNNYTPGKDWRQACI